MSKPSQKSGQYLNGVRNAGVNIGHSSRLDYDKCAYEDRLLESVSPLHYRINANQIHNKNAGNPSINGNLINFHFLSSAEDHHFHLLFFLNCSDFQNKDYERMPQQCLRNWFY